MTQTTDGYIWLATVNALLRFDGVRGVPWRPPSGTSLPDDRVRALFGAGDGALWIGTLQGLVSLKDGALVVYPALQGKAVNAIEEDLDGTIWVGGTSWLGEFSKENAFLCAISKTRTECHGQDGSLGRSVVALYRDSSNALWVAGTDRVWNWTSRPRASYALPSTINSVRVLAGTPDGAILVATQRHVVRIADGKAEALSLPKWARELSFTKVRLDRDGALWLAAADFGLLRLHGDRVDALTTADGLSGNQILDLFEDREGNLWVSTARGLDQFRPVAGAIFGSNKGLEGRPRSILAARDGGIWAVTTKAVYRLDRPDVVEVRQGAPGSLFEDRQGRIWLYSLSEVGYFDGGRLIAAAGIPAGAIDGMDDDSKGNIWIAHREAGLLLLRADGSVEQTPWARLRPSFRVSTITVDPNDDSLWLGSWSGALMNVANGEVRSYFNLAESRDSPRVSQVRIESDGTVWVANGSGLNRIRHGRITLMDSSSGLPCDRVLETLVDEHSFWMRARCGVIQVARSEIDAWGAAADRASALPKPNFQVLDHWDGVGGGDSFAVSGRLTAMRNHTPFMTQSRDGRVWIKAGDGIVMIDPSRLPGSSTPPPVHVEQLVSDGKHYESRADLRLPPLQRNLAVDYTGLSFSAPEKVQFRYKLEGRDADWQDAGQRRQAFYTDLSPGHYRFRVMAANASGVWNRDGDTLEFSIEPAWWQTTAFRTACVVAVALLLYGLYRLRIGQLSRRFSMSLETRVGERMRIARELHDTLLQTFQGLVLRLQTAHQLWPSNDGRRILGEGIDQAAEAITEGRDAVQGLRGASSEPFDLADAIRALAQVLVIDPASRAARFSVEVQGRPRKLHPVVRDDAFRIVGEALRNAYRHAEPKRVEVEVRYDDRAMSVRVRDDGKGMDRSVAQRGRAGHFGLHGMRERANLIGGKLTFWSRVDAGTEVELSVPAVRAYAASDSALYDQTAATLDI